MRALSYIAAAGAALALASTLGCAVHQTDTPSLSGPSGLALSMSVSSTPQTITQNGADASVVTAKVIFTDPSTGTTGPKANIPIRFDMAVNGQLQDFGTLSARNGVTDASGTARVTYTAPPMPVGGSTGSGCNGVPGQCVQVVATTTDTTAASSSGALASGAATIALVPPGVVLPPAGTPKAAFTFLPATITVGQQVTFDASTSCPTDANGNCSTSGSITSYAWTFGDGSVGAGKTITHAFTSSNTFVVTLTVTSDRGLTASTSQGVDVGLPTAPSAAFVFSPQTPVAGQVVFFSAETSRAATGHSLTQFTWNYGDGTSDSGLTVSHTYALAGSYNVVLSVMDDAGQKATATTSVPIGNAGPVAKLSLTKSGLSVVADASLSTPTNNVAIATYAFNFGDGSGTTAPGTAPIVSHPYAFPGGTFTVTVIVTDVQGHSSATSATITVP